MIVCCIEIMAHILSLVLDILSRTQHDIYHYKIKCINYQYLCFNCYYRLCHRPSILKGFKELVWSFILCLGKSKYGKVPFKINWLLKFQHKQTMSIKPVYFYIRNRDIYVMYPMIKVIEMYIAFEPFCEYSSKTTLKYQNCTQHCQIESIWVHLRLISLFYKQPLYVYLQSTKKRLSHWDFYWM